MGKFRDLTGQHFGRLTVTTHWRRDGKHGFWLCHCSCGRTLWVRQDALVGRKTKSCGCGKGLKHGHAHKGNLSPTYQSWAAMLRRCRDRNCPGAHRYVKRGITVCERWKSFKTLLSDMGERPPEKRLSAKTTILDTHLRTVAGQHQLNRAEINATLN